MLVDETLDASCENDELIFAPPHLTLKKADAWFELGVAARRAVVQLSDFAKMSCAKVPFEGWRKVNTQVLERR